MTPLELARDIDATYLYDILSPVVRQTVPPVTIQRLQHSFHELIRSEMGRQRVEDERLYLPVVEVLLDLDGDVVWFPIKSGYASAVCLRNSLICFLPGPEYPGANV